MDSRILLPGFAEIGKAEETKQVRGIHHKKRLAFWPCEAMEQFRLA